MAKKSRHPGAVGYGKPPRSAQFRKGQSGNPGGRPKGAKVKQSPLLEALAEVVEIPGKGGRTQRISKHDLSWKQLATKAAKGDQRALELVIKELAKLQADQADSTDSMVPPKPEQARVIFYMPDNGRRVERPVYEGVDAPLDDVVDRIKKNDQVLAILNAEEKAEFHRSLGKIIGELNKIHEAKLLKERSRISNESPASTFPRG
jgi:hypothetical protein